MPYLLPVLPDFNALKQVVTVVQVQWTLSDNLQEYRDTVKNEATIYLPNDVIVNRKDYPYNVYFLVQNCNYI